MDPYNSHPDEKKTIYKKKKLTKQEILSILKEESERISRETIPTWGWTTHDLFEIIDNIETRLEDYTDVEHG